jgi:sugar O-acyltransferase (sialic acid O-acetyltransferase NeuD family)
MNSDNTPQTPATLIVFGVGGHGRVVADAALLQVRWTKIVATARSLPPAATELLSSVKILAMDHALQQDAAVHIAIGNNTARQTEARALGLDCLVTIAHPSASVSNFSQIGPGCFVAAGAVIAPAANLGAGVIVNHGAVVDHDTEVGDFSHIAQRASVCGHAKLGRRVLVGSGAVVLSSVVLGDDVVLSPGSLASADLLMPGVYSGNPAVKIE